MLQNKQKYNPELLCYQGLIVIKLLDKEKNYVNATIGKLKKIEMPSILRSKDKRIIQKISYHILLATVCSYDIKKFETSPISHFGNVRLREK